MYACKMRAAMPRHAIQLPPRVLSHPGVEYEGPGPVSQDVGEKLENEYDGEGHVEVVCHFSQLRGRTVAQSHLAAVLRLEDAHKEVLRGPSETETE